MAGPILAGGARRILPRLFSLALFAVHILTPAMAPAMVLGTDERNAASAFFSAADENRFEGLGRIECRQPGSTGLSFHATGWIVGSADTVMTAAHIFFEQDRRGERTIQRDPANCVFVLFNQDQSIREVASIRYAVSPWADNAFRGDSANDFAVLKLARPVRVTNIPSVKAGGQIRPDVQLAAFQSGVPQDQRARITHGEARRFPVLGNRYEIDGMRVTNTARLFSTSASSSPGSSGGLYYDRGTGSLLGIHLGAMCDTSATALVYDPDHCFNYGLRFDQGIRATIDAVVHDMAPQRQLISPGKIFPIAAPTVLALASRG